MVLLPNAIENTNPFALTYMSRLFSHRWSPGGGGIPGHSWWGCAARFSKSWPSFRIKKSHFPHPFSDLASKIHTPSLWYLNKRPTNPFWMNFLQGVIYVLGFYKHNFFMWMFFMSLLGVERSNNMFTRPNCRCKFPLDEPSEIAICISLVATRVCAVCTLLLRMQLLAYTFCVTASMIMYTFCWYLWNGSNRSCYKTWLSLLWGFMMVMIAYLVGTQISLPWTVIFCFSPILT